MRITIFNNKGKQSKPRTKKSTKRGNFTQSEKEAYNAGKAYAAAKAGKRVQLRTKKERDSFRNGVKAVRG